MGIPQIGPGRQCRFRTPTLCNVAITGPWGHNGAYNTLEGIVRHHMNSSNSLNDYDTAQAALPARDDLDAIDFEAHQDTATRAALADSIEIAPIQLNDDEFHDLIEFLHALTDTGSLDLRDTVPSRVPNGLPLAD
ncbi:hypothetical protein [Methylomonas sp. MgM2]